MREREKQREIQTHRMKKMVLLTNFLYFISLLFFRKGCCSLCSNKLCGGNVGVIDFMFGVLMTSKITLSCEFRVRT